MGAVPGLKGAVDVPRLTKDKFSDFMKALFLSMKNERNALIDFGFSGSDIEWVSSSPELHNLIQKGM